MCICNCAVIHSKTNQILFLQNSMYTKLCTKAMRDLRAQLLLYVYIYTWSNLRMREYRELDICSWYPVPSWRLHIKCTVCVCLEQHLRLSQFMICLIDPEGKEKKEELILLGLGLQFSTQSSMCTWKYISCIYFHLHATITMMHSK